MDEKLRRSGKFFGDRRNAVVLLAPLAAGFGSSVGIKRVRLELQREICSIDVRGAGQHFGATCSGIDAKFWGSLFA
jgi:hypothetical protein